MASPTGPTREDLLHGSAQRLLRGAPDSSDRRERTISLEYCVYVLLSLSDQKTYVGYTTDLQKRLTAHFKGRVPSTAPRRPFRLVYCEYHYAMSDAKRREHYLKTSAGKAALKRMIRDALAEFQSE